MLKSFISKIFRKLKGEPYPKRDFSDFFRNAGPEERDHVIREAIRKSNEDQRKLMEKYRSMMANPK